MSRSGLGGGYICFSMTSGKSPVGDGGIGRQRCIGHDGDMGGRERLESDRDLVDSEFDR